MLCQRFWFIAYKPCFAEKWLTIFRQILRFQERLTQMLAGQLVGPPPYPHLNWNAAGIITIYFLRWFLYDKKLLICRKGKSRTSRRGRILFIPSTDKTTRIQGSHDKGIVKIRHCEHSTSRAPLTWCCCSVCSTNRSFRLRAVRIHPLNSLDLL